MKTVMSRKSQGSLLRDNFKLTVEELVGACQMEKSRQSVT